MFVRGTSDYYLKIARHDWIKKKISGEKPSCVVIKVTEDCNLRCKYCYTEGGKRKNTISVDTVLKLFDQLVVDNSNDIDCVFHGGEPLLHISLIRDIIEALKKRYYGPRISYKIQTNATLISDDAIALIKKYNIDVGISLDGYKELNDLTRVTSTGGSSFHMVEKGIRKLQSNEIFFGVLCLITKHNVNHMVDILEWFRVNGIDRFGFTTFTPLGYGKEEDIAPDIQDLCLNVIKEIDWLVKYNTQQMNADKRYMYEREIEALLVRILKPEKCAFMCTDIPCGAGIRHIGMDVNGNINICDCFYGMDSYVLGNICVDTLDDILSNNMVKRFTSRKLKDIEGCRDCNINTICHGGCPSHNILFMGDKGLYTKNYKCEFFYTIYNYLLRLLDCKINPACLAEMFLEEGVNIYGEVLKK